MVGKLIRGGSDRHLVFVPLEQSRAALTTLSTHFAAIISSVSLFVAV
jgi:hypothetical protein